MACYENLQERDERPLHNPHSLGVHKNYNIVFNSLRIEKSLFSTCDGNFLLKFLDLIYTAS